MHRLTASPYLMNTYQRSPANNDGNDGDVDFSKRWTCLYTVSRVALAVKLQEGIVGIIEPYQSPASR